MINDYYGNVLENVISLLCCMMMHSILFHALLVIVFNDNFFLSCNHSRYNNTNLFVTKNYQKIFSFFFKEVFLYYLNQILVKKFCL
jgi:hypothetical protein